MGFSVGFRMGPVRVSNKGISAGVSAGPFSYSGFRRWGGQSYSRRSGRGGGEVVVVERPTPEAPSPFPGWTTYAEYLDLASREHLAEVEAILAVDPFGVCPPTPTGRELDEAAVRIYRERK
jgi:hypothetical protein